MQYPPPVANVQTGKLLSNMVSRDLGLFNFSILRLIELLFLKFIYFAPQSIVG